MKKFLVYGMPVLLVVIAAGGFFVYKYYSAKQQAQQLMKYNVQAETARTDFNAGNYSNAITQFSSLIPDAPNKGEAGRLQLLLAASLMYRNQPGDLQSSVSILVKLMNDYTMPPVVRALALNSIAADINNNGMDFYQLYLANVTPFNTYLPANGTDADRLQVLYFKTLELSDQTYPNSYAEYTIAGNYYAQVMANGKIASADLKSTAQTMQKYVAEGDALHDSSLYSSLNLVYIQAYRALALSASYEILKSPDSATVETAFQLPLTTASKLTALASDYNLEAGVMRDRFFYAMFLLRNFGNTRNADIETILKPFAQARTNNRALRSLLMINTLPAFVKATANPQ